MPDDSLEVDALCRVARGDREALACLYDAHGEVVYGVLMTILRQPSEAQDLLHDVFVEVLERAGDYDPRRGSVRGWLLMRARSRALDRVRSARVRRERAEQRHCESRDSQQLVRAPCMRAFLKWRRFESGFLHQ